MIIRFLEKICEHALNNIVSIYTHNINFDGLLILDAIKNRNIFFDMYVRENNIYWIKIIYLKITIFFRCSYKIIPLSVKNMGILLNCPKKIFPYKFVNKDNLNYVGVIPDSSFFNSEADYLAFKSENDVFNLKLTTISYCLQDVEIVYKVLFEIILLINSFDKNLINKCYSFSSISYKLYLKQFDK